MSDRTVWGLTLLSTFAVIGFVSFLRWAIEIIWRIVTN